MNHTPLAKLTPSIFPETTKHRTQRSES